MRTIGSYYEMDPQEQVETIRNEPSAIRPKKRACTFRLGVESPPQQPQNSHSQSHAIPPGTARYNPRQQIHLARSLNVSEHRPVYHPSATVSAPVALRRSPVNMSKGTAMWSWWASVVAAVRPVGPPPTMAMSNEDTTRSM